MSLFVSWTVTSVTLVIHVMDVLCSGAVPADTDWLDLARPVIEKRIQK